MSVLTNLAAVNHLGCLLWVLESEVHYLVHLAAMNHLCCLLRRVLELDSGSLFGDDESSLLPSSQGVGVGDLPPTSGSSSGKGESSLLAFEGVGVGVRGSPLNSPSSSSSSCSSRSGSLSSFNCVAHDCSALNLVVVFLLTMAFALAFSRGVVVGELLCKWEGRLEAHKLVEELA